MRPMSSMLTDDRRMQFVGVLYWHVDRLLAPGNPTVGNWLGVRPRGVALTIASCSAPE